MPAQLSNGGTASKREFSVVDRRIINHAATSAEGHAAYLDEIAAARLESDDKLADSMQALIDEADRVRERRMPARNQRHATHRPLAASGLSAEV